MLPTLCKVAQGRAYTSPVPSVQPQPPGREPTGTGWTSRPPGHLSLSEAAERTGYTAERLRQLARAGRIECRRVSVGNRQRVWVPEHAVARLRAPGRSRDTFQTSSKTAQPQGPGRAPQPVMHERDRWRAEALRLREAGLRMSAALDAMSEAGEFHAAAADHLRAAATDLGHALGKAREALSLQNDALREFMIPSDIAEN